MPDSQSSKTITKKSISIINKKSKNFIYHNNKMSKHMETKNILDTRNFYNREKSNKSGFNYFSI